MRKLKSEKIYSILAIAILLYLLMGCQDKKEANIKPFISVEVKLNQRKIPINSPVEMSFCWKVVEKSKRLDKDYKILVHFLDKNGEMFFNDDHVSPINSNLWNANKPVEYERTVFLSNVSMLGKGKIKVGLYEPSGEMKRHPLIGKDEGGDRAYTVADIEIIGEELDKEPIFKEGWYEPEFTTNGRVVEWTWTMKEAEVAFLNPGRDAVLYLYAHSPTLELGVEQNIIIELNGKEIHSFTIGSSQDFLKKIKIEQSLWGEKKWADVKIIADKTFVPSTDGLHGDTRELGIKVYNFYLYY